jgi:hypothetical protein
VWRAKGSSGQEDDSVAENIDVPKTIDNVSCRLGDDIANFLDSNAVVYVASSGFSLSAFEHLADELESLSGFGETDGLTASGVTTLEAALVRWSAALAGMGVRAGEGVRAFAERHYRLEVLRAQSADLEKKIVREKQLDRKYELLKEKRQLEKEVSLWLK